MLLKISRTLLGSSALRAALALGGSGLALAVGNLLLARILPPAEFALFTLVYAFVMIGISIGPIGADVTLTRRKFNPGAALHLQILLTSSLVAGVLLTIGHFLYPLRWGLTVCAFVAIVAGAVKTIAVAYFRSYQRFGSALMLSVSTNLSVMAAAIASAVLGFHSALWPCVAMALALSLTSFIAWRSVAHLDNTDANNRYLWSEGLSAMSFSGLGMVLSSLDRLVIPNLLGMTSLATFSVLSTISGSPFHMLHIGVGYTLQPALRNAHTRERRMKVFRDESLVVIGVSLLGGLAVILATPYIVKYVLADRYHIGTELVLAAVASGMLKVAGSLMAAVVNALGSGRHLAQLSLIAALSIGVSFVGAFIGSHWGLMGLVYGVSAGWLFRAVAIGALAVPHLMQKELEA